MKFKIGDLVYGWDTYRGIIGTVKACYPKQPQNHAPMYALEIIKKTQATFHLKRWDDEGFWENELDYVIKYDEKHAELNDRSVLIKSDEEIINIQLSNPFGAKKELIILCPIFS